MFECQNKREEENEGYTWIAPAATITSLRAKAVYRIEPPADGANSTPDAVNGREVPEKTILVACRVIDQK